MMELTKTIQSALESATEHNTPFKHWSVNQPLTQQLIDQLVHEIEIPNAKKTYDGTRAGDVIVKEGKNTSSRIFITPELLKEHAFLKPIIDTFTDSSTVNLVKNKYAKDAKDIYFRAECIFDHDGFYLVPHQDIVEKLFTLFIYLGDAPEHCGTDLYDSNKKLVKTVPFKNNTGYVFVPGKDTWHGFEPKKIPTVRRALMLNYVTFKTEWPIGQ